MNLNFLTKTFCPCPNQYNNKNELNDDLLKSYRNLKLKMNLGIQPQDKDTFRSNKKRKWMPSKPSHVIEIFMTAVDNDIDKSPVKTIIRDNLTQNERKTLKEVQQRDKLITTRANKGGAFVIWSTDHYINEANRQLNETYSYKNLDNDPTESHTETIKKFRNEFRSKDLIDKKIPDSLISDNVKIP